MLNRPKPPRRLPPLNALRAFEMAARHMSFSVAASELNVTQSAISRQIKTLEDFLGIELFKRLPRSLGLTEAGARFAEPLHNAFDQLYEATATVMHPHRPATLNINVLPTFAMKWLIPRLLHFTAANPNIEVRMITSIRPADFRMEENDIAIRVAPLSQGRKNDQSPIDLVMTQNWADVRSMPFLPDTLIAVCSPALLARGPAIKAPGDLRHHMLLQIATREKAWPFWLESMGLDTSAFVEHTSYGHFFMTIQAAIEGKGVALVPNIFVESELKSGMLVPLFGGKGVLAGAYYFLCRESQWRNSKIERFREWLLKEAGPIDWKHEAKSALQIQSSVSDKAATQ
jgi:LysR family glycine cleavage system transcriptional activator